MLLSNAVPFGEDHKPHNLFVRACAENNLEEVRRQIRSGIDINEVDNSERDREFGGTEFIPTNSELMRRGITPTWMQSGLTVAMLSRNEKLLRILAEAQADLHSVPKDGYLSATDAAIASNYPEGLRILTREFGFQLQSRT